MDGVIDAEEKPNSLIDIRCVEQAVRRALHFSKLVENRVYEHLLEGVIGALRWDIQTKATPSDILAQISRIQHDWQSFPSRLAWCGCMDTLHLLLGTNKGTATAELIHDALDDLAKCQ